MQQLKMRIITNKVNEPTLPEGFNIRVADDDSMSDRQAWVNICKNGLLPEDAGVQYYEDVLIRHEGYKTGDTFFVVKKSESIPVATVTTICLSENEGYVHMVAACDDARGLGIGNYLSEYALYNLTRQGRYNIWLTTDDFRVPAIKSYLRSGFRPVDCDTDMEERWLAWVEKYGYNDVEFLDEKGTVIKYLNNKPLV